MSCSVHDVAGLEDSGVATVFVASDEFVSARQAHADWAIEALVAALTSA